MESLFFDVQGSEQDPYKVSFIRRGDNITATCTCRAGKHGMHCKHRINLLNGIREGLVSNNASDVTILVSWIPGSDLDGLLQEYTELQRQSAELKKALTKVKKRLTRALLD